MDAQCQKRAVFPEHAQNIGELNILRVLGVGLDDVAFLCPQLVEETHNRADQRTNRRANGITGGIAVAKGLQQNREGFATSAEPQFISTLDFWRHRKGPAENFV